MAGAPSHPSHDTVRGEGWGWKGLGIEMLSIPRGRCWASESESGQKLGCGRGFQQGFKGKDLEFGV